MPVDATAVALAIAVGSSDLLTPAPQHLGRAVHLSGNRHDRRPLRVILGSVLGYHPDSRFLHFGGKLRCSRHGAILSSDGAPENVYDLI